MVGPEGEGRGCVGFCREVVILAVDVVSHFAEHLIGGVGVRRGGGDCVGVDDVSQFAGQPLMEVVGPFVVEVAAIS